MDEEHPEAAERWDADRDETEAERLDRNWSSLLQELRVAQTGVQLLTGFLLTLPFQQRFTQLDTTMRTIYLVTVACSLASTLLLVAPVAMHRVLFRKHRLKTLGVGGAQLRHGRSAAAGCGARRCRRGHLRHRRRQVGRLDRRRVHVDRRDLLLDRRPSSG